MNRIIGTDRVEAIESIRVDDQLNPIPGTEEIIPCDTLLLSVGLIPENELSRKAGVELDPLVGGPIVNDEFETNVPGIFAAGNVVHVYDLADWVAQAGLKPGESAAKFAKVERSLQTGTITTQAGKNVRYVVPQHIHIENLENNEIALQLRVRQPIEKPARVIVRSGDQEITRKTEMYARPGEMITIKLKPKDYGLIDQTKNIVVDVVER